MRRGRDSFEPLDPAEQSIRHRTAAAMLISRDGDGRGQCQSAPFLSAARLLPAVADSCSLFVESASPARCCEGGSSFVASPAALPVRSGCAGGVAVASSCRFPAAADDAAPDCCAAEDSCPSVGSCIRRPLDVVKAAPRSSRLSRCPFALGVLAASRSHCRAASSLQLMTLLQIVALQQIVAHRGSCALSRSRRPFPLALCRPRC